MFLEEAKKYDVFPLDNSQFARAYHTAAKRHRGTDQIHLLG